jgi:hypothetical protein
MVDQPPSHEPKPQSPPPAEPKPVEGQPDRTVPPPNFDIVTEGFGVGNVEKKDGGSFLREVLGDKS